MSTLKQMMERIETLRSKRELIDAMKEWLGKNFTGSTGVGGKVIPTEVVDELLVDIDCVLVAPTNEEIESLESMEIQNGKATKRSASATKPAKKGHKRG